MDTNKLLQDPAERAAMARCFAAHPRADGLVWYGEAGKYLLATPRFRELAQAECIRTKTSLVLVSRAELVEAQQAEAAAELQDEHPDEDFSPATILQTTTKPTNEDIDAKAVGKNQPQKRDKK